jgi:RNA polymerase sigma-70 factor (ECF subfamily)
MFGVTFRRTTRNNDNSRMTDKEYNQCVEDYSDSLYRFLLKNMKDRMEAENIVQNTFEKLWVRKDDVIMATAKSFMYKVAYNNMIDEFRKNKRVVSMNAVNENRHFHQEHYSGATEVIKMAVNRLPENQKTVIILRDYEGYDYKTIGEITGMSEAQVKINIFRARQTLKEYFGKMEQVI